VWVPQFFRGEYNLGERTPIYIHSFRCSLNDQSLLRIVSPILHYQMAPIVYPSWPRMGSDLENPFQNVPGPFIYALPDLRFSQSSAVPSTTVPSTPSLQHSPPELRGTGKTTPLPCDERDFDHDECPDTTLGESEPKQGGEADSELDANPRSDSRTPTPSPLSPTSSTSSGQERTTEKTKRSRRRRRRNRQVADVGCVMGPRTVLLPVHIPYYWIQNHTPGVIIPPSPWSPGYPVVTAPGGDPWFEPQAVPGY